MGPTPTWKTSCSSTTSSGERRAKDLSRVIRDSAGLLAIDYCVDVILVVCAAIQACHHKGIIHRDLKPGNVMVIETDSGPGWDVKVLDFSISSISKVAGDLTRDGQIIGTPRFLSPEQVEGKVLPASDQYAIGLLLYVCLAKKHPLGDLSGLPLIRAIERGEIPRPRSLRPEIPEELEDVIMTAVHVDPAKRFNRVHDLGRALWPFGSQLGQGVWKKYYFETPPAPIARDTAKASTTGIPLVLRMAKGDVPMSSATAVAHYQSTTAVQAVTAVDDHATRTAADPDGGTQAPSVNTVLDPQSGPIRSDGPSAPSGWSWQSSAGSVSAIPLEQPSGRRRKMLAGVLVLGAAMSVAAVVGLSRTGRKTTPAEPAQTATVVTPAIASSPGVVAPAAPPTPSNAGSATGTSSASAAAEKKADERKPKTSISDRTGAKRTQSAGWEVDPKGVPILPEESATRDAERDENSKDRTKHRDRLKSKRKQGAADWEVDANGFPIPAL